MENQNKKNVDAKAAELREKLNDEALDKCKVTGGDYKDTYNWKDLK